MQPNRLLAIFAIVVVLIVLALYLTSDEERFLEPENTGPPEVTQQMPDTTARPKAEAVSQAAPDAA